MNRDELLLFMIFCYIAPILYVYYNNTDHNSISTIICDENCKHMILFFMVLMGVGTVLYELERDDPISTILISLLLISIYGLICINEKNIIHYIFAFVAFITILCFMFRHAEDVLFILLLIEVALALYIVFHMKSNGTKHDKYFLWSEIAYVVNFAIYYIYLHFRPVGSKGTSLKERSGIISLCEIIGTSLEERSSFRPVGSKGTSQTAEDCSLPSV